VFLFSLVPLEDFLRMARGIVLFGEGAPTKDNQAKTVGKINRVEVGVTELTNSFV
jgi:hypothetical protein